MILLARAPYRQRRLLILGRATRHQDMTKEQRVVAGLGAMSLTRILVAHRTETINTAVRVIVMGQPILDRTASPPVV